MILKFVDNRNLIDGMTQVENLPGVEIYTFGLSSDKPIFQF